MNNRQDIYNLLSFIKNTKNGPYFSKEYLLKTLQLTTNEIRKFKINNIFNEQ